MLINLKKIMISFIALLTYNVAFAGDQTGTITSVIGHDVGPGHYFVAISGTYNSQPACNVNGWTIRADTAGGKAMIATILTAFLNGKSVQIVGSGVCTLWGDREDAVYVSVSK